MSPPPQRKSNPLLQKMKSAYLTWYGYYQILPKAHRHSLGQRIDTLLIHSIEAIAAASFLSREKKLPYVQVAIRKIDTLKAWILVSVAENHDLPHMHLPPLSS